MERAKLIQNLKDVVQEVLGDVSTLPPSSKVSDANASVVRLCYILDQILSHGLKDLHFFGSTTYWEFLRNLPDCVPSSSSFIDNIQATANSDTGRGRLFICLSLCNKTTSTDLQALLMSQEHVREYYQENAILRREEETSIVHLLLDTLGNVDFTFKLEYSDLDDQDYFNVKLQSMAVKAKILKAPSNLSSSSPLSSSSSRSSSRSVVRSGSENMGGDRERTLSRSIKHGNSNAQSGGSLEGYQGARNPQQGMVLPETPQFDIHEKLTLLCQQDEQIEQLKLQVLELCKRQEESQVKLTEATSQWQEERERNMELVKKVDVLMKQNEDERHRSPKSNLDGGEKEAMEGMVIQNSVNEVIKVTGHEVEGKENDDGVSLEHIQVVETLQKELEEIRERMRMREEEVTKLTERNAMLESTLAKNQLEEECKKDSSERGRGDDKCVRVDEKDHLGMASQKEIEKDDKKIKSLEDALAALQIQFRASREELADAQNKIDDLEIENGNLQCQGALSEMLQAQVDHYAERFSSAKEEIER